MIVEIEQIVSRNYGRKNCSSVGTILGGVVGGPMGAAIGTSVDSTRASEKASDKAAAAQRDAANKIAEEQRAAAAASPHRGNAIDTSAIDAATRHRRGIQSTFLASRLNGSGNNLGE